MAARELRRGGAPVLMYHGIGDSIPAGVSDREGRYWVSPGSLERQLAQMRNGIEDVVAARARLTVTLQDMTQLSVVIKATGILHMRPVGHVDERFDS